MFLSSKILLQEVPFLLMERIITLRRILVLCGVTKFFVWNFYNRVLNYILENKDFV